MPKAVAVPLDCPRRDAEFALVFTERFNEAWRARFGGAFDMYCTLGIKKLLEKHGRTPGQPGRTIRVADEVIAAAIEVDLRSQR